MASEGPNNPTAAVDNPAIGTIAWNNPTNVFSSDDSDASTSAGGNNDVTSDEEVKIIKSDGSLGGENKADTVTAWPSSDTYITYGGVADTWSESMTGTDVNNSNFGVAISGDMDGDITHYLKASDFNFSIPATDIIDGIKVEIEKAKAYTPKGGGQNLFIDHIRLTVYHSSAGTNMQINIGDIWKDVDAMKTNIGDDWKDVVAVKQNIGDAWKDVF